MKFSAGQIAFVIFFVVLFVSALIWSYKSDKNMNRRYYSGAWKVLITLALVLIAIFYIMKAAKNN